jgi:hypothetical protein
MTTLVLQAAGSAIGSFVGGPIGAIVGRAAGALAGSVIDGALFAGKRQMVEGPRLKEMDGLASSEGAAVPRLYGRARLGGQLIWATRFEEQTVTSTRKAGGGKGLSGQKTRETTYSYYANLAIGLCEGPISFVRRVWADGREIDLTKVTMRVHRGDDAQMPDALIVAKEGAANAPAYRGTAYVVFERLPLADYGNRVPQLAFEVVRALAGLADQVRSVNLIPGSSEFAYETGLVTRPFGLGNTAPENRHQLQAPSDVMASLDQLQALCPDIGTIQIIASWFGDDLRAGNCTIAPRVDNASKVTDGATWGVAGLTRTTARLVTEVDGRAIFGGTPSDASLLALIAEIRRRGLKVVLYPFIMMDIGPSNVLPNPQGGAGQPALPWRGRITSAPAPGQPGTVDATEAAATQISAFVGTVTPADISLADGQVICAKPDEWSFRRHILHYARLAEAAGGVDGFIIGSEMVGLSRVRSASGVYPFVSALQAIAVDARAMLGPGVRITYAADWTEYGAHVLAGGQEVRFPLDPLWASSAISAVGIDYYAPISDWRDGVDHLDAGVARSHHDADYLAARQTGGEAFDWFYASEAARRAQTRTPITDGAFGKPWMFRAKDMANWWLNPHRERVAGAELGADTVWVPGSKPIWLTEVGCPAVDKGANAPNVFPDPKSSENALPFFSSGERDDLAQLRALEAQLGVFDPASPLFQATANPLNGTGTARMIAPSEVAVWAWDARPFPAFPMLASVWSDGGNWSTGHWLNGRLEAAPLDRLVSAILADFGLQGAFQLDIDQIVDGYVIDRPMSARAALEPLARMFGLDASFNEGRFVLRGQSGRAPVAISLDQFVPERDGKPFELRRAQETELPRELRVGFVDGNWDYRSAASRSRRLAGAARREVAIDAAIVTSRAEADRLAEQRLKEAWVGRETLTFRLSPRDLALEPGDVCTVPLDGKPRLFRITQIADGDVRRVTAVSSERHPASTRVVPEIVSRAAPAPALAGKPFAVLMELPVQRGSEPVLQFLAAHAAPWPGSLDVLRSTDGATFDPFASVLQPALVGRLVSGLAAGPLWRWDRAAGFDIEIEAGALQSVSDAAVLGGANAFAVLGPDGFWEIVAAASITLVGPRRYRLSHLLRGLGGSEPAALRPVASGALIVGVDEALAPLGNGLADLGRSVKLRIVPAGVDAADPSVVTLDSSPAGLALRPLSPVHLRARRDGSGVNVTWIRRTRIDGDNWQQAEVPLWEAAERYKLQIYDGAMLRRQVEVATPAFLYTAAMETADLGGPQAALDIAVAQISGSVGPGIIRRSVVAVN